MILRPHHLFAVAFLSTAACGDGGGSNDDPTTATTTQTTADVSGDTTVTEDTAVTEDTSTPTSEDITEADTDDVEVTGPRVEQYGGTTVTIALPLAKDGRAIDQINRVARGADGYRLNAWHYDAEVTLRSDILALIDGEVTNVTPAAFGIGDDSHYLLDVVYADGWYMAAQTPFTLDGYDVVVSELVGDTATVVETFDDYYDAFAIAALGAQAVVAGRDVGPPTEMFYGSIDGDGFHAKYIPDGVMPLGSYFDGIISTGEVAFAFARDTDDSAPDVVYRLDADGGIEADGTYPQAEAFVAANDTLYALTSADEVLARDGDDWVTLEVPMDTFAARISATDDGLLVVTAYAGTYLYDGATWIELPPSPLADNWTGIFGTLDELYGWSAVNFELVLVRFER